MMANGPGEDADLLLQVARRGPALVIDDDATVRDVLHRALTQWGFRVLAQESGRNATSTVISHGASLVITDIFMPDTDGVEVIRALRRECPGTPIIAMSGNTLMGHPQMMLSVASVLGADAVLTKPFSLDELKGALLRTLEAR